MTETPTTSDATRLFLHNMRALWRFDPVLALRVDAVHDDERFAVEPTRSEHWTVKVPSGDGRPTYLHSRYNPVEEANRLVEAISIEEKFCFVVSGLGLGYHVKALFERLSGDALIVCIEPSVRMIATALAHVDLRDVIASGRLILLIDGEKTRLHERLKQHGPLMMLGTRFVKHPPSMRVAEKAHAAVTEAIAEFVTFTRMSLLTLVSNARITCKNIAMNLVSYVTMPPIDILCERFAGNPAVVISAGPSLARNIDQLAALKGKAVLCAVQTTLQPLLKRGIVPDFVTSLDFHEMSRKFFERTGDLRDTHLVAEPKATWHVIDGYPGPVSLLDNAWARLVLGDDLAACEGLQPGATVSHLAFYLAVHMGCDPIIFVGQDLAFTGHVFYVPGVEIHRAWRGEINRFNAMEQREWERIVRNRPILRRVPGVGGGELYTDELLLTYLEQFEKDIARVPCGVINATEGGARIRGTREMTLAEAADTYCRDAIDPARFAYRREVRWHDPARLPDARAQLEARLEELDEAASVCEELLTILKELKGLTGDSARFNRRLVRVDELRARVSRETRAYQIINAATQLAELKRFSADRRLGALQGDEVRRATHQLDRDIEFITAVRDGAREVTPILTEALARIARGIEGAIEAS